MITKLATFRGISQQGDPLNWLFRPNDGLEKMAGVLMPGVQQWLHGYEKKPNELVVLVNAMGASEYWGQNINGDIFYESALLHDCRKHPTEQHPYDDFTGKIIPPYGYWTFLNALPFVHHKNKDPNRAFGKVAYACWNARMRRVELIVVLNKTLAMEHGAQSVIDKIEAGEFPDVSMGCKVPYDVCAVCGNKSKTRDDYCSCVKQIGMGKILDDGRRIGVINPHPRFFDISFVFIGADKTAKVMAKLASVPVPQSVADADQLYATNCGALDCMECRGGCRALQKVAGMEKKASIFSTTDRALERERDDGNLKLTQQDFNRIGDRFGVDGHDLARALVEQEELEDPRWPSSRTDQIKELTTFARQLENPFFKQSAVSTPVLRTLIGGGAGAIGGATMGALGANEDQKGLGALVGGGVGGVLGAGAGYGMHRLSKWLLNTIPAEELAKLKETATRAGAAHSSLLDELKGVDLARDQARAEAHRIFTENLAKASMEPVPDRVEALRQALKSRQPIDLDDATLFGGGVSKYPNVAEEEVRRLSDVASKLYKQVSDAKFKAEDLGWRVGREERRIKKLESPIAHAMSGGAGLGVGVLGGMAAAPLLPYKEHERPYEVKEASIAEAFEKLRAHKPAYRQLSDRDLFELSCKGRLDEVFPPDPQDSDLMMSRLDNQVNPHGTRSDGMLRTNYSQAEEEKLSASAANIMAVLDDVPRLIQSSGILRKKKTQPSKEKQALDDGMAEVFGLAKGMKIGPPPARNRKEFPFVGTINFRGLTIHVENRPGDVRSGVGEDGKKWRTEMKLPYGEIVGTDGTDGDKVDVYVGPFKDAPNVYIVHQNKVKGPDAGKYDEDKVMMGFRSPEEAKAAYLAHYNRTDFFRSITTMAFSLFKRVLASGEVDGEKVATVLRKVATHLDLDELFAGAATARRRQRTWRDEATGVERNETGSGLKKEEEEADRRKEASVKWDSLCQEFGVSSVSTLTPPGPAELLKLGSDTKVASHSKWAELVKEIGPSKAVGRVSPLLSDAEPSLPKDVLDGLGAGPDLEKGLSTLSLMGMVLKPEEFQRIALAHLGKGDLADELDEAGITFKPSDDEVAPCKPLSAVHSDPNVMKELMPFLGDKSYFGPIVRKRIIQIMVMKPHPKEATTQAESPLLSKVAGAYTWYRREMMKVAATQAPFTVPGIPALHAGLYELGDAGMFKGAESVSSRTAAVVLGSVPLSLMYSAHKRSEGEQQPLGFFSQMVASHPWLTALGVAAGLRELLKSPEGAKAVDTVFDAAKRAWAGRQALSGAL